MRRRRRRAVIRLGRTAAIRLSRAACRRCLRCRGMLLSRGASLDQSQHEHLPRLPWQPPRLHQHHRPVISTLSHPGRMSVIGITRSDIIDQSGTRPINPNPLEPRRSWQTLTIATRYLCLNMYTNKKSPHSRSHRPL